jgi:polysaccharide export outer membrane protein
VRPSDHHLSALALTLPAVLSLSACGAGSYVWVDDLAVMPSSSAPERYVIATGDLLNIRVYTQDAVSTRARVSPDGTVAVPLLGEVTARGLRPSDVARQIQDRLKPFIVAPSVSITLDEVQPPRVSVVGEVAHAGVYTLPPDAGVLLALALAGGLTEFADKDRIFVVRTHGESKPARIRMTYQSLVRATGRAPALVLQAGDAVVVE